MKSRSKTSFLKLVIPVVIIAGIMLFITKSRAENDFNIPSKPNILQGSEWWNNDFAFRKKVITSSEIDQVIKINHSQMVIDNKSIQDGSDLRVVAYEGTESKEVPMDITNPDTSETLINFSKSKNVTDVYLYYGNKSDLPEPTIRSEDLSTLKENASLSEEETPELLVTTQKKWNLKEKDSQLILQVADQLKQGDTIYYYLLDNEQTPRNMEVQNGFSTINPIDIQPGDHNIFLIKKSGVNITRSNSSRFILSEPIYIAWTVDWEGIDPGKPNIENISKTAVEFKIPITHFFSPRTIISTKITEPRKKEIINWIKDRVNNFGDDLAMNLHFQFDLVDAAGVDPKYSEKTWDNGISGYDMPGTVYDYNEYLKILNWGKQKLIDAGLPSPKGFRAGGWFINDDNLRAVKDAGFVYDSSAIKPTELGENKMMQDWETTSITQPYKISQKDKNSSDDPTLGILEVPINGGDTYINSAEEILQNFKDNYSYNTYSNTSKLIVYSSSPDWFDTSKDGVENLFATVSNYRYDRDRGPVKFITLNEWLDKSNTGK
ncbi:MAG: hypothetical protein ABI721_00230 [Candidatus Dojkabacteria bacterium]